MSNFSTRCPWFKNNVLLTVLATLKALHKDNNKNKIQKLTHFIYFGNYTILLPFESVTYTLDQGNLTLMTTIE